MPGILIRQARAFAQRHVFLDECGSGVDPMHPRAPIKRVRAPQWWQYIILAGLLPFTVLAMTQRTLGGIHLRALGQVEPALRWRHFRIGSAWQFLTRRYAGYMVYAAHSGAELALRPWSRWQLAHARPFPT